MHFPYELVNGAPGFVTTSYYLQYFTGFLIRSALLELVALKYSVRHIFLCIHAFRAVWQAVVPGPTQVRSRAIFLCFSESGHYYDTARECASFHSTGMMTAITGTVSFDTAQNLHICSRQPPIYRFYGECSHQNTMTVVNVATIIFLLVGFRLPIFGIVLTKGVGMAAAFSVAYIAWR